MKVKYAIRMKHPRSRDKPVPLVIIITQEALKFQCKNLKDFNAF